MDIQQNTLYLTTPGSYVARDHLTLQVEVPVYPEELPTEDRTRDKAADWRKVSIPIHHLESLCVFGASTVSPPALDLCWEHGVAVNYLSQFGHLQARMTGVADTSVTLRRTQFRAADDPMRCAGIARQIIAGKIQNSRNSLLRAARETESAEDRTRLEETTDALARQVQELGKLQLSAPAPAEGGSRRREEADDSVVRKDPPPHVGGYAGEAHGNGEPSITSGSSNPSLDQLRGNEGMASSRYFAVFSLMLKQQRDEFAFTNRSRRPPRDRVNCLLSFLYALVRHDCIAALTAAGLDPFVGFLHVDRPNRPSLALDLMEEFRPWLADRLAVTLVNRQQLGIEHFREREGGAVEFTEKGRKLVITAYQQRKQETVNHPLLEQNLRIAQLPFIQARVLARHLRGDIADYVPFVPK
ncbi:MAG: CRISPR-associated endonuclease Cas1 [Verrucomicrobia bacterium]|nr:CRISPR-associated endonuclease Cas1 [Verrucomicrobiota bacterium]